MYSYHQGPKYPCDIIYLPNDQEITIQFFFKWPNNKQSNFKRLEYMISKFQCKL